ncbi:MAG: hypothetical protein OQK58_06605, partial [Gammaproteobacteria bacterium]|nr:hypothetical protein [Gammaproteobacteria bacterium]
KVLEYEKNQREPGKQRRFLDGMDLDMDEGIELNGEMIDSPDKMQRANYVSMSLLYGIENKNEGMVSATCGYLVNRLPGLKQIRATEDGDEITLDLIFDEIN